jgi:hypothetical protein
MDQACFLQIQEAQISPDKRKTTVV